MFGCLIFYDNFSTQGKLNGPSDLQRRWGEVNNKTLRWLRSAAISLMLAFYDDPTVPSPLLLQSKGFHSNCVYDSVWGFLDVGLCICLLWNPANQSLDNFTGIYLGRVGFGNYCPHSLYFSGSHLCHLQRSLLCWRSHLGWEKSFINIGRPIYTTPK